MGGFREMKKKTKALILALCAIMLVGATFATTLAWLTDKTDPIENVFTVGNIDIELEETDGLTFKMVPGKTITKDPTVTVKKDSEACWLFVKVVKDGGDVTVGSTNYTFDDFLTYVIADGWTELSGNAGVYYREVAETTADTDFKVLKDDVVTVKTTVTKEMMDAIAADTSKAPTLTFTAYACQKAEIASASAAWAIVGN